MIDPNKVTEAVMEFMENPTWKGIFMNAPGGAMERLAISFYFSKFHDQFQAEDFQEYRDLRDEYEKSLTEEDLNYLIENSDKDNAKKHYQELLANLQQSGGQPQGKMRFEKEGAVQPPTDGGHEQATETEEETVKDDKGAETNVEETATETEEKKPSAENDDGLPPIDNTFAKQDEEEAKTEPKEEAAGNEKADSDETHEQDEKLNTALSVALNYLQNEEKQMGNGEDNDEKKK